MYVKTAIKKVYYENNTIKHTGAGCVFHRGNMLLQFRCCWGLTVATVVFLYFLSFAFSHLVAVCTRTTEGITQLGHRVVRQLCLLGTLN